jgi:glucokinase
LAKVAGIEILVFDVGGSHIAASRFEQSTMQAAGLQRISVNERGSEADFLTAFERLADTILPPPAYRAGVAIAIPNPFDYEAGISLMRHKYRQLYGKNLRQSLAERLRCEPMQVHFLNDAAAFLLGEINQGAAAGVDRAIGITLGTGVGSAFAVGGTIVTSGMGVPPKGEIWDLPYRSSSVEDIISTRSIQRLYEQRTAIHAEVRDIAALGPGDGAVRDTFETFGRELGGVLRELCIGFAPQRVVLGGGISHAAHLFLAAAEKELADPSVHLLTSTLCELAPLVGAGVSWKLRHCRQERETEPSRVGEGF